MAWPWLSGLKPRREPEIHFSMFSVFISIWPVGNAAVINANTAVINRIASTERKENIGSKSSKIVSQSVSESESFN